MCGRATLLVFFLAGLAPADGKVVPPRDYKGSLEEKAQEAIIIFHGSEKPGDAVEDLILKITVQGETKSFAWVVPFPNEPQVQKADAKLFEELYDYVQARHMRKKGKTRAGAVAGEKEELKSVDVLSRRVVGSFDVAVVRENVAGSLNKWLAENGYQTLEDAEDVLGFYRKKGYVFACIKVAGAALKAQQPADIHPLRFTFKTGGRDGVFFPMKMTGLQKERFDVNLYVFYRFWLNDRLSKYGYAHRGLRLKHRDWDTPECKPNGGKAWTDPSGDVFLKPMASKISAVTKLLQALHPGERYYLTNIYGSFGPDDVRSWNDDLWLFPYYTDKSMVPYDARPGGCAAAGWRSG